VIGQDEPLDVVTIQAGLYAGMAKAMGAGDLGIELYAGGGYNKFEQERTVRFDTFVGNSSADYSGTHINASARAGYEVALSDRFWVRPAVSLDYLSLKEDAYTEGFSVAAGSAYSSIGFDFDSDIRDGFIRHTGRVVVRLLF